MTNLENRIDEFVNSLSEDQVNELSAILDEISLTNVKEFSGYVHNKVHDPRITAKKFRKQF
jgi:hypothetical protein